MDLFHASCKLEATEVVSSMLMVEAAMTSELDSKGVYFSSREINSV